MTQLRPALIVFSLLFLVTAGGYPLLTTLAGQWWFPYQSQGSLITTGGQIRGSALLGQNFTSPGYFHARPSATGGTPYNPLASGGSNLAVSNPQLTARIAQQATLLHQQNPLAPGRIPTDLLTASASGLDNGISPAAAEWQRARVAKARGITEQQLQLMIEQNTLRPWPAFIGEAYVNVTRLNAGLDKLTSR